MRIIKEENVNTGGGCMVYSLWIENGGDIRSININEEVVAASIHTYDDNEEFTESSDLWFEYYEVEWFGDIEIRLLAYLPKDIVDRIMTVIKTKIWKDR